MTDLKDNMNIEREQMALSMRANMIFRKFARCTREVKLTLFRDIVLSYIRAAYGGIICSGPEAIRI